MTSNTSRIIDNNWHPQSHQNEKEEMFESILSSALIIFENRIMITVKTESMKIEVLGAVPLGSDHILSEPALSFVGFLCAKFEGRRQQLLQQRKLTSIEYDSLQVPTFQNRPEVLADDWLCASVPPDVEDRRVEITGPVG